MIKSKRTLLLGIFIFILPFLGVPTSWKTTLIILSGLALIALSLNITIPKKSTKRPRRKEKVTPVFVENAPIYPRRSEVPPAEEFSSETES